VFRHRVIALTCVACFCVRGFGQEPPKADAPAERLPLKVMQAWENAEKKVQANRKIYDNANAKALESFQKEIEKIRPAVDVAEIVRQFQQEAIVALDEKAKPPAPPAPVLGDDGVVVFNGHKYKFFMENLSWEEAKKKCEDLGGYLLIIDDRNENMFILNALKQFKARNPVIGDNDSVWLGILRDDPKGGFVTLKGAPQVFSAWRTLTGHPKPGDTRGRFHLGVFEWVSSSTTVNAPTYFICEWDK
jgi:hypothetical protein